MTSYTRAGKGGAIHIPDPRREGRWTYCHRDCQEWTVEQEKPAGVMCKECAVEERYRETGQGVPF